MCIRDRSSMYPISKNPWLWGLFQYTKEVVIEFGYWTRYVVYVSVIHCYCTGGWFGVVLSFMYSVSKDPQLWRLFQYTKEVVIEVGHWMRYVVYVSVIVCYCTGGLSSFLLCTLFLRTHARVWRLFQYTKEVVIEFLYWTRYVHVHVHVVNVSVIAVSYTHLTLPTNREV